MTQEQLIAEMWGEVEQIQRDVESLQCLASCSQDERPQLSLVSVQELPEENK